MIIISQEKDAILNFKNITAIWIMPKEEDNGFVIRMDTVCNESYFAGKYATRERAKEVLKEMREKQKYGTTSCMIAKNEWQEQENVYEMPTE